jgi:hypothetical protein
VLAGASDHLGARAVAVDGDGEHWSLRCYAYTCTKAPLGLAVEKYYKGRPIQYNYQHIRVCCQSVMRNACVSEYTWRAYSNVAASTTVAQRAAWRKKNRQKSKAEKLLVCFFVLFSVVRRRRAQSQISIAGVLLLLSLATLL